MLIPSDQIQVNTMYERRTPAEVPQPAVALVPCQRILGRRGLCLWILCCKELRIKHTPAPQTLWTAVCRVIP